MQKIKILWYKFKAKAISSGVNLFASQTNFDVRNTVLLVGSARSGTTFLMESLNARNDYRIIFEPFNPTYTKEWKSFSARHYIDPQSINENERIVLDNILRGKIKNNWVDQYNKKFRSDKRLIKAVRANLLLDFIESEYPDLTIIYTYRNPFDVVASRINLNFDTKDIFLILNHNTFLKNHYSDIDIPTLKALLNTPESCHAALWCFENRFILQRIENHRLMVVQYEDMIGKTVEHTDEGLVISEKIRRPSVTSSVQKSYKLTETEIQNIREVLTLFEMREFIK